MKRLFKGAVMAAGATGGGLLAQGARAGVGAALGGISPALAGLTLWIVGGVVGTVAGDFIGSALTGDLPETGAFVGFLKGLATCAGGIAGLVFAGTSVSALGIGVPVGFVAGAWVGAVLGDGAVALVT